MGTKNSSPDGGGENKEDDVILEGKNDTGRGLGRNAENRDKGGGAGWVHCDKQKRKMCRILKAAGERWGTHWEGRARTT